MLSSAEEHDLLGDRAIAVLNYLHRYIYGCKGFGCSAFQTRQECGETKDFIFWKTHSDDDFILSCQDCECDDPIYACTQHAYKYLLHSTNDHWFCKDCFKEDENKVFITHRPKICGKEDKYTFVNVKNKKLCDNENCICKKYTTAHLKKYIKDRPV